MIDQVKISLVHRLEPIVHTLGWEIVKTVFVDGDIVVTLIRTPLEKPLEPFFGSEG